MSGRGAVHNALTRGPFGAALSRAVGDSVGSSGLERYGETLTPILDLWRQLEWAYLRGELVAAFDKAQPAVAAEFGAVALVNPTGSNRLYVIERISAWVAVQTFFTVAVALEGVISATLGLSTVSISLDTRWRERTTGADRTTGLVYIGSDPAGIGGQVERMTPNAGGGNFAQAYTSVPLVLQPGWGVALVCGTVNVPIEISMRYRERTAFPGELE